MSASTEAARILAARPRPARAQEQPDGRLRVRAVPVRGVSRSARVDGQPRRDGLRRGAGDGPRHPRRPDHPGAGARGARSVSAVVVGAPDGFAVDAHAGLHRDRGDHQGRADDPHVAPAGPGRAPDRGPGEPRRPPVRPRPATPRREPAPARLAMDGRDGARAPDEGPARKHVGRLAGGAERPARRTRAPAGQARRPRRFELRPALRRRSRPRDRRRSGRPARHGHHVDVQARRELPYGRGVAGGADLAQPRDPRRRRPLADRSTTSCSSPSRRWTRGSR